MSESYRSDNVEEIRDRGEGAGEVQTASAMLRHARENKGLTQQDIADQLYLSLAFVRYIDEGEFHKIPKQAFVKGYLRSYARLVKLSADDVVACYQKEMDAADDNFVPDDVIEESIGSSHFTGPVLQTGIAGLAGVLVIIALVWWLVSGDDSEPAKAQVTSTADVVESLSQLPTSTAGTEAPLIQETADLITEELASAEPEEKPAATAEDVRPNVQIERGPEDNTNYITVNAGGEDRLEFSFSDGCWVEIQDAAGASIYADLNREGDRLTVSGIAPFRVLLGHATSVSLQFNNENIDLGPYVSSDNTARVTLGN